MSESLYALRQRPHISNSGLFDYINCSLKYRFARVDKLEPEFRSSNFVLGSGIHKVMELYYKNIMEEKNVPKDKELFDCLEDYIRGACKGDRTEVRFGKKEDLNSVIEQGKDLIRCFLDEVPEENSQVIAVEQPFSFEIPSLDVPVIGSIDLLLLDDDGTVTVIDHKTSTKSFSNRDVHFSSQLTVYQKALKSLGFEGQEIVLAFQVLIKTKKPKLEIFYTSRSEADEQRQVKIFQEAWKGIQAGIFLPNDSSWLCSNCEYKTACKSWAAEKAA